MSPNKLSLINNKNISAFHQVWRKKSFANFKKMVKMRTSLLYPSNFQNLKLENCDIILTLLRSH